MVDEFGKKATDDIQAVIDRAGAKELMAGLMGHLASDAKDSTGNIDIEHLRVIDGELKRINENSLDAAGKAAILTFCVNVWNTIKDDLTSDTGVVAQMMVGIAGFANDGIKVIFDGFHAASEATSSWAEHVALCGGEGEGTGMTDPKQMKAMKSLVLKKLALDAAVGSIGQDERKQCITAVVNLVNDYITASADKAMTTMEAQLDSKVELAKKWCRGGSDEELWW